MATRRGLLGPSEEPTDGDQVKLIADPSSLIVVWTDDRAEGQHKMAKLTTDEDRAESEVPWGRGAGRARYDGSAR